MRLFARYVLRTRYALRGVKGFISYRIYRKVNISSFPLGQHIELQSNISQKRRRNFRRLNSYYVGTGVPDCPFNLTVQHNRIVPLCSRFLYFANPYQSLLFFYSWNLPRNNTIHLYNVHIFLNS